VKATDRPAMDKRSGKLVTGDDLIQSKVAKRTCSLCGALFELGGYNLPIGGTVRREVRRPALKSNHVRQRGRDPPFPRKGISFGLCHSREGKNYMWKHEGLNKSQTWPNAKPGAAATGGKGAREGGRKNKKEKPLEGGARRSSPPFPRKLR